MTDTALIDTGVFAELQAATGADFVVELVDTFAEELPGMLGELRAALEVANHGYVLETGGLVLEGPAEALAAELKAGAEFTVLAARRSTDEATRMDGGDLGYVEERVDADGGLVPHLSARLSRFVG